MTQTEALKVDAVAPTRRGVPAWVWQSSTIIALVVLVLIFTVIGGGVFLRPANITNIAYQIAILAIIAVAQTVVMVVGDFDLSVGTTATLGGATAGALMIGGTPIPFAIVIAIAVGAGIGLVNGVLVAYFSISPFITTLAMMTTCMGLTLIVTDGTTLYGWPDVFGVIGQGRINGIPFPVVYAIVIALLMWLILRFTTIGRKWYAIGGSAEVARLSGVPVRSTRMLAFVTAGALSALAGVVLVSRLGSAGSGGADSNMMYAVAATFLGMTLLRSGRANVGGTIIGVLIIGVVQNGLNLAGVNTYVQQVLIGIIIIAAVLLSSVKKKTSR